MTTSYSEIGGHGSTKNDSETFVQRRFLLHHRTQRHGIERIRDRERQAIGPSQVVTGMRQGRRKNRGRCELRGQVGGVPVHARDFMFHLAMNPRGRNIPGNRDGTAAGEHPPSISP